MKGKELKGKILKGGSKSDKNVRNLDECLNDAIDALTSKFDRKMVFGPITTPISGPTLLTY